MDNQKKIRRFIPCSLYCTSKIESWLEEMASEGLILYTFSKFDYAVFTIDKPQKIRYRLCLKGDSKHEAYVRRTMQKYGWQSIGEIKNLIVFSSQDPKPFETNDNCELTELRNKAIKYRSRQNIISFLTLLFPIAMFIFFKNPAISAVNFGMGALLLPISMILFVIARLIIEIIDINTYKKYINDYNAHIKNTSKINLILFTAKYLSVTLIFLSFIFIIASPDTNKDIWYSNSDGSEKPPFATVENFISENVTIKNESNSDAGAMYQKWSNAVSSVNYYWIENEEFIYEDGTTERLHFNVSYHETSNNIFAKWLVWDFYFEDKLKEINSDVIKLSEYDIDFGLTYHNWNYLVVIARKDNKIIKAEFESVNLNEQEVIEIICSNF